MEGRYEELGGYMVEFETFREDADATPLFKGLPDDRCQSPHWGYVVSGQADLPLRRPRRGLRGAATPTTRRPGTSRCRRPAPSHRVQPDRGVRRTQAVLAAQPRGSAGELTMRPPPRRSTPRPSTSRAAAAIEAAEARAWTDLYAAAPADWAAAAGVGAARARRGAGAALGGDRAALLQPRDRARARRAGDPGAIDEILAATSTRGSRCSCSSRCRTAGPAGYERWLRERGLEPFDAQDRVVRGGSPLASAPDGGSRVRARVERVAPAQRTNGPSSSSASIASTPGRWLPAR